MGKFSDKLEKPAEVNVYADKSSLVLYWLLTKSSDKEGFSIREVAQECMVSVGLVQRILQALFQSGLIGSQGVRTAKKFFFKKSYSLLEHWLDEYSLVKKCKTWTYRTGFSTKEDLLKALKESKWRDKVVLALHAAADAHGCKNTNLNTLELYLLDPLLRSELEKVLQLEPQERGYEVLLIQPYYKGLLSLSQTSKQNIAASPPLLTFLDLFHFPLRGQEQAEFMAERLPELKRIYKGG